MIFVTGTGTGVGKTLAAAALLRALGDERDLLYVKPVQTGCPPDDDAAAVAALSGRGGRVSRAGVRLPDPVSPHLAAARAGDPEALTVAALADTVRAAAGARRALVEGAGGLLVPLNAREVVADLADALDAVVVVAALGGLGTINHTLLTLTELRRRGRTVAGVVLLGEILGDNAEVIADRGEVAVLGGIPAPSPALSPADAVAAAAVSLDLAPLRSAVPA